MQVGHACLEAAAQFGSPPHAHLVLCGVPDKAALYRVVQKLEAHQVPHAVFYEPDDDMGETALCTSPLEGTTRKLFRHLPLWR